MFISLVSEVSNIVLVAGGGGGGAGVPKFSVVHFKLMCLKSLIVASNLKKRLLFIPALKITQNHQC